MNIEIIPLERKADARGWFLKVLMGRQISGSREFGEIYLSVSDPGQIRGGHYHERATEWFCLIRGTAVIGLLDMRTQEKQEIALDAQRPVTLVIPPRIAHAIRNTGQEQAYLLAYSDVPYDPAAPDTVPHDLA